jgi:hypothetical protein
MQAQRNTLKRMTETMANRGPDAEGIWITGPIGFKLGFSKSHCRPVPAKSGCGPGANIVSTSGQPPGADISYEAVPLIYVEIFRAQAAINLPGQQTSNSQNPSAIAAAVVDMISRANSACSSIKYLSAKAITLGCQRQVARLCGS